MARRANDDERQKDFAPPERGEIRDMRDEWKIKKAVLKYLRSFSVALAGGVAMVAVFRQQVGDLLTVLASLVNGGGK